MRFPADPPTVEEIILVMREAGPGPYADRTRGRIAILWRAGLRISEALALTKTDLDPNTGCVLVRAGKSGTRRMVGMDVAGPTRGRGWSATAGRGELRRLAARAGDRRIRASPPTAGDPR
jgi:integrase